jgi:hypothetical protein
LWRPEGYRGQEKNPRKRKAGIMAKVAPIYSAKETDRKVYHDDDRCTERNNIEMKNIRQGTGNRPRCDHCARLSP